MSAPAVTPTVAMLGADTLTVGMLSTYPPTRCGIATFAAALERELVAQGLLVRIVRVCDGAGDDFSASGPIVGELQPGSWRSRHRAAAALSKNDVAIIQHDFGIYGGPDGEEIVEVMRMLRTPAVLVLHTIPAHPTAHQAVILAQLRALAARVVVMTDAARDTLLRVYGPGDRPKVVTIAHGANVVGVRDPESIVYANPAAQLLTWGLLGPGKGIEHAVDAVARLARRGHDVCYTIAGVTHPKVHAREGDSYLDALKRRVADAGVGHLVTFDDTYRDVAELTRFVSWASVIVLPYDSRDQVTSGVLVESIAAGRPVIATAFPHAVELLRNGAGVVVPHGNPAALGDAIAALTTSQAALRSATIRARELAPAFAWPTVARGYVRTIGEALYEAKMS